MTRARRRALASSIALALMVNVAGANAQPAAVKNEARARFDRGIALADEGDLDRALAEFRRAYELVPNVHVLLNIAEVEASLGRAVDATRSLDKIIAEPGGLSPADVQRARTLRDAQAARVGELTVETNIAGARIDVDGQEVATTPLSAPIKVSSGTRVVGAVAAGHAPIRKTVVVAGKSTASVRFDLVPLEGRLAHLEVRSSLPGATISVDGQRVATTPVPATLSFAPGTYTVEAQRDGYQPASAKVVLGEGATGTVTLDPVLDPNALAKSGGDLDIDASEPGAATSIDGRHLGVVTRVRLPPGQHALRIEKAGFVTVERNVLVSDGQTTTVHPYLVPTPETRSAYESHARTMRTTGWALLIGGGAVAVGGGIASFVFTSERSDAQAQYDETFRRSQAQGPGTCIEGSVCLAEFDAAAAKLDDAKTRQTIGFVVTGVGAAALVSGIVVLLVSDDPHKYDRPPPKSASLRPVVSPVFTGLAGTF